MKLYFYENESYMILPSKNDYKVIFEQNNSDLVSQSCTIFLNNE